MATNFKKSKGGVEDLFFDSLGTSQQEPVPTSSGNTRTVSKINATHIPTTVTTRAKKSADDTTTTTTDVDTSLQELYDDTNSIGVPDNDTLENSSGTLQVKALGVGNDELKADAVDGSKIADNSIDSEHYVDGSIDPEHLDDLAVETAKINNLAVTTGKLGADSVTNEKVADNAIGPENMDMDGFGTAPVSFPVLTGQVTMGGTGATETFTVTGAVVGDKMVMTKNTDIAETLQRAAITAPDTLTLTHSATTGAGDVYDYIVFRAAV